MTAVQETHHVIAMIKEEAKKKSDLELIDKTDKAISGLVCPKPKLLKAYNYYNGIRDAEQFRYLEEVYGANTPTALHFTPLIKKHLDALLGEYLGTPIIPKVSCKDSETINNIDREKLLEVALRLHNYLKNHLQNSILKFLDGKSTEDSLVKLLLKQITEEIDNTFVSLYEIAAQHVLDYIMQSRQIDIMTVLRDLFLDLLITGYAFYKVEHTPSNSNIRVRALSPLNTFIDMNRESPYIKNSYRVVVRSWMSRSQILSKYGKDLTSKDKKILEDEWGDIYDTAMYYVRMRENSGIPCTDGLLAGIEATPGISNGQPRSVQDLIPVYEVEWLETDDDNIMQRYETVRIGEEIYILYGKNEKVMRSKDDPSYCSLSVNGVYYLNRGSEPYSMVLACAHLLDQYDLLHFYRDNLIANSGTVGDWIDLTLIPAELGAELPERLVKWQAYKKQGLGILDSSLEGRLANGLAPLNTIFNGFDNTVKEQAVAAIQVAIDSIEQTTSSITGVFRERLNGIELRDAVTNIQLGVRNSFTITKPIYHLMDLVVTEMLLDCLNEAKVVFKKGLTGTIVLGDKEVETFTALPEYFTLSDHDIRITTSTDVVQDLENLKAIIPEFVKSGGLPPDIIMDAITCKSIPDLKYKVQKALLILKLENNQLQLLTLQVDELQNLLKLASQDLERSLQQVQKLNQDKLLLEQQEMQMKYQLEWFNARTDRQYKEDMAEEAKKRTEAEIMQLYDGNPYNDKIRQIGS